MYYLLFLVYIIFQKNTIKSLHPLENRNICNKCINIFIFCFRFSVIIKSDNHNKGVFQLYSIKNLFPEKWRLYIVENNVCSKFANEINCESMLKSYGFQPIEATVPGNFELDMEKAGLIDNPFYADNPLKIQKLENRHLWYSVNFDYSGNLTENTYLNFGGIDTFSDIYLNGLYIGSTDNMFIPYEFFAEGIKKYNNELLIHIKPTVIEARKFNFDSEVISHLNYNAASLATRKAAHSFGWDIFPRFVSAGIWRDCFITEKKDDYIEDIFLSTVQISNGKAIIAGRYSTVLSGDYSTDYSLIIEAECKGHKFSKEFNKLWHNKGVFDLEIEDPLLWWVRDMGEQNLYNVKATLYYNGNPVDTNEHKFGIRTVKLVKTDTTDENGNGEFCFYINGERVYIRGTNWVALDAFHSRDKERLKTALDMLLEINCNAVRCWGGNVYEDHEFFDFCDKYGILVWQDFAMGCATYPQDPEFLSKIRNETEIVVKKLRRHSSIALWAGDNECDETITYWKRIKKNPCKNKITRDVIPEVLSRLDPYREYLPSSPYVSEEAFLKRNDNCLPERHLWGPRDYFKGDFYVNATAHFASETGYHGCPSPESLKKFISPEKLWPWQNNDEWQIHSTCMELGENVSYSYRNPLMASQIKVLFGEIPRDLETFSLASQFSQAEAVKFFIENFRSQKWRRTGLMWWNLVDGWPQISDAVVDYYYDKKQAYEFIKRSQEPLALIMREPENNFLTVMGANDFLQDKKITFKITDLSYNKSIAEGCILLKKNANTEICKIPFKSDETHFYLLEWEYDNKKMTNHYISGAAPYDFNKYLNWLKEAKIY